MVGQPTPIPWPLSTSPGQEPSEASGRLINCYAEPLGENRGVVYHRAPGVSAYGKQTDSAWTWWALEIPWFSPPDVAVLPAGLYRGGIFVDNVLYVVLGTSLVTITQGGAFLKIGNVPGSDGVFFASNNAAPVSDIVLVCQAGVFSATSTSLTNYPDSSVGSPTCVVGAEGFFIFGYGNGDMVSTNINTTTINLLNLARTETNPDGVIQMIYWQGQLYAFGEATCEIWGSPINPTGFPFTRVGYNFVPGLIGFAAISGWQPEFGQPPIYVGSDHTVRQINGYTPDKISTPQLDRLIKSVPNNIFLEALCYVSDGVPFWQLSSDSWTWVYNCANAKWHERNSYYQQRSRLTGSVFAFDRWLCGDTLMLGYMLEPTGTMATEDGMPFIASMQSLPVENFPIQIACPRADFEFQTGVGIVTGHDPDQTNPYSEISWSDDGGQSWTGPKLVPVGRQGKTRTRVSVYRTGLSGTQGRIWKVALPSAVHLGFMGGTMTAIPQEY